MAKAFKARSRIKDPTPFEIDEEVFHIRGGTPGSLILDVFKRASNDKDTSAQLEAMNELFDISIITDDKERWKAYINDPANGVTLEVLMEIMEYVVEVQSGGRPTEVSEPSTTGSPTNGPGLVGATP